jgi:septal ring factor EnvC (AmiA/AmiB activator)
VKTWVKRILLLTVLALLVVAGGAGCLRQITNRFDHLSDQIDTTNQQMRFLNQQLEETKQVVGRIDQATQGANQRVVELDKRVDGMNSKAADLEPLKQKAIKIDASLSDTNKKLATVTDLINRVMNPPK